MKTRSLVAALLLVPMVSLAQPAALLNIIDPEGDDVGDGVLVYPRDSAFTPGDLDLRSLRVFADGADLRFEATFRNPIRDPSTTRGTGLAAEDLSRFSRRGFYAFNLDIYLDTDRVNGSGNTVTLPGRRAMLDPAHAWEKAIVLTPRPEVMRRQFTDALKEASPGAGAAVEATVDRSVFFATDIRVRGRTVSFIVPGSFVDAKAVAGSSVSAMVTLAKLSPDANLSLLRRGDQGPLDGLDLGVAQPEAGRPEFAMGYSADRAPATAVVDLLSPDPRQQAVQLAPGALLTGLNRDNQMGTVQSVATSAATTPALAPPAATSPATSGSSWFSSALAGVTGFFGASTATSAGSAPDAPAAPTSTQSVQSLMSPGTKAPVSTAATAAVVTTAAVVVPAAAVTVPAPAASAPRQVAPAAAAVAAPVSPPAVATAAAAAAAVAPQRPRDAAFFEEQEHRLRTLKRLRDNNLITEDEYQQKRREVLDKL